MTLAILVLWLSMMGAQAPPCGGEAARHVRTAIAHSEAFDLQAAAEAYRGAAGAGCADAGLAAHYLTGLAAARAAYAQGGSAESLAPVTEAIAVIDDRSGTRLGQAPIARLVLHAAAAAAQSERDAMSLLLDEATRLEAIQIEARQPPLPGVSAHEAAGDLWLQVHGYEAAARAYRQAEERIGRTPRVRLGQARLAARTGDPVAACRDYAALLAMWQSPPDVAEIAEARAYLALPACAPAALPSPPAPAAR